MRRCEVVILMLAFLLFAGGLAQATLTDLDIYIDATIESGAYMTVNIYDTLPTQTTVIMNGGSAESIWSYNSSMLQMKNGSVSRVISAHNESSVVMSSGLVASLQLFDCAVAYILGGEITASLGTWNNAIVHIYGNNFNTVTSPTGWLITGNWANNVAFSILYRGMSSLQPGSAGSPVILHTIPEPCMIGLLCFGMLSVRRTAKTLAGVQDGL